MIFYLMNVENGMKSCKVVSPSSASCSLSGWALIEYVFVLNFLWWVAYFFIILITKQSGEWSCRFLTMCHGCIVFYSAAKDIWSTLGSCGFGTAPLSEGQKSYLSFMLSYFIFDFFWIYLFGNESWVVYFHHTSSILIIIQIIKCDFGGTGISYGAAGLEFTNPYLQLRWFLRSHGFLNTPIHTFVELWFFFAFLIIRLIGGTYLFYKLGIYAKTSILMKISLCSVYGVSIVLAWQIIDYFKRKYLIHRTNSVFALSRVSIFPFFQRRSEEGVQRSTGGYRIEDSPQNVSTSTLSHSPAPPTTNVSPKQSLDIQEKKEKLEESS